MLLHLLFSLMRYTGYSESEINQDANAISKQDVTGAASIGCGLTSNTEEHVLRCVRKQRRSSGVDVDLCISITKRKSN